MASGKAAWGVFVAVIPAFLAHAADPPSVPAPAWRAGAASAVITPARPLPMAGYAARKGLAEGAEQDLFAKALAIEDQDGNRVVFLTLDLIGVLDRLRTAVAAQLQDRHHLPPHALVMNASHTHCGPAYGREESREYFDKLTETLVVLVGEAIEHLEPASLSYCYARCGFAMNRRTPGETGYRNHPNPAGPVDHVVPVLRVANAKGELRAVLFGYACHNTTMGFLKWLGDYAGYAQEYFQKDHPGVVALFLMGCGADQNPYPRGVLDYAQRHGRSLATAVEAALEVGQSTPRHQRPVHGPLRCVLDTVELDFIAAERPAFAYPVQVVRFGQDLSLIALGSETVVDYSLRLKRELAKDEGPAIWVAGYSNCYGDYVASQRILREGGYEADNCPWKPTLEDQIVAKARELHARAVP